PRPCSPACRGRICASRWRASCNRSASAAAWWWPGKSEIGQPRRSAAKAGNRKSEITSTSFPRSAKTPSPNFTRSAASLFQFCRRNNFRCNPRGWRICSAATKTKTPESSTAFWPATSTGRRATRFCSTPAGPCLSPGKPNRLWKAGHWRRRRLTAAKRRQNSRSLRIDSVRRVFHRLGRRGFLEFQRGVMQTQIVLRGFVALPRGLDDPLHRLLLVLFHAAAGLVTQAKIALGGRAFLFGGGEIPSGGLLVILRHHLAGFVKHAEVELRRRVALLRRFAQPFGRLAIFLRHARAVQVADAEITLRHRIILVRRPAEPLDRLLV